MKSALLNHEVGSTGVQMQGRDGAERPVGVVRLEPDIVSLGHRRDLLQLQDAACLDNVWLNQRDDLALEQVCVVPLGE